MLEGALKFSLASNLAAPEVCQFSRMPKFSFLQATWAFVRAAVPLLKQVVGGRVELASQQVAPQLCCALARLCGQTTQGGRAFAAHIFKECRVHLPHSIFTWCHAVLLKRVSAPAACYAGAQPIEHGP